MGLKKARYKLEQKKGVRNNKQLELKNISKLCTKLEEEIEKTQKAQVIIRLVAKQTQEELEYRIKEPVSLALGSIFDNPYKQSVNFELSGRGTTECHLNFERDGVKINPFSASGGGPIDVASFALRLVSWSLKKPSPRNTIITDEPFRFVSKFKIDRIGQMLKETSKKLNIQIIMITHVEELIDHADKVFKVRKEKGISTVESL